LPAELRAFVAGARVDHFATASVDARPHAIPVCFVVVDGAVVSVVDDKPKSVDPWRLRRLRNLAPNPRAALVVDSHDEDWSRLRYVLIEGATEVRPAPGEQDVVLAKLREKYPQYRDHAPCRAANDRSPAGAHPHVGPGRGGGFDP
jgi:PPOX class probable F420-dependent enzyme